MSCSSDTSAYTTELDRTGATAGVPTSVTTASKTPGTMRVMGSSSQSIDDVCTAVSRTLLPTPPTRSANTCAARAPLHLSLTATSVHLKRELTANELAFDGADPHSIGANPDRRPSRKSTSTTRRRPVRVGQRSPAAPAGLGHRGSPRTGAPCSARTLRTPLLRGSSSAGGHLDRRRAVGQVHRVGHRDEHFARSLEGLPAVRGADVVHKHQVPSLPSLACGVCLVDLVDQLHDVRADRVAVAKAGIEGQPVLAVDVHEVLAHLRVHRPLVEECDLVEPALLPGKRVMHDGAAALPGAQRTVGLPLELDRIVTAVTLDGATVVGAESFSDRRPNFVVVVAD